MVSNRNARSFQPSHPRPAYCGSLRNRFINIRFALSTQRNQLIRRLRMEDPSASFDERLQIAGRILQSVGISAVIWGADALIHHAISTTKSVHLLLTKLNVQRNDIILPNEDFLRAAEALRLHNFAALEPTPESPQHLDGLDQYAAQYTFPPEITERLGSEITIALFPASLVGWKLVYIPIPDPRQRGSFTTALAIQKLPVPVDTNVEQSFIQLSLSNSDINDAISVTSEDSVSTVRAEIDDEYIMIEPHTLQQVSVGRRASVAMERGNGPKTPSESICDIVDMKPEVGTCAIEMLPGQKMLEKSDRQLVLVDKGIYVPRREKLKESFKNAAEFLKRDNAGSNNFAKVLEGWNRLLGGHEGI